MKFTIELSNSEVAEIKDYLKQFETGRITKDQIKAEIQGIVTGVIHSQREAVSDYIRLRETDEHKKRRV